MINIKQPSNIIQISRGDAVTISFEFFSGETPITFTPQDEVIFSVKKDLRSRDTVLEKRVTAIEGNVVEFAITTADLIGIPFGEYKYDVRIKYSDGRPYTPILPTIFQILEVVGNG